MKSPRELCYRVIPGGVTGSQAKSLGESTTNAPANRKKERKEWRVSGQSLGARSIAILLATLSCGGQALEFNSAVEVVPGAADGSQHAGNCASCHPAPNFSDFSFHNTGVTQEEYDKVHGAGAFMNLSIPSPAEHNKNYDLYLPATADYPHALEPFRRPAEASHPDYTDLGLRNVYLNPDMSNPQPSLKALLCGNGQDCSVDQGLERTIGRFKTPTLRDLEDSNPYFHNGSALTLEDVIQVYINSSRWAREGLLRNPPPEFQGMSINQEGIDALTAFL